MPSPNEPVQPTPFEAVEPVRTSPDNPPAAARPTAPWVLPALGGLLLLALLVVFWLPGRVPDTAVVTDDPETTTAALAEQPAQGADPAKSSPV